MSDSLQTLMEAPREFVNPIGIAKRTDASDLFCQLETKTDYKLVAPVDVDAIARLLGIKVVEQLPEDCNISTIGSIGVDDGVATVWLNAVENSFEPRRRFTLAHEIGHFCLHIAPSENRQDFVDTKRSLGRSASYWDTREFEANHFAADLLMPVQLINKCGAEVVEAYRKETGKNLIPVQELIERLAVVLVVSRQALEYRLKNLSVI